MRYKPQQHAHLDALVAIAPWQLDAIPSPLREHTARSTTGPCPIGPAADARQRLRAANGIASDAWVFGSMGRMGVPRALTFWWTPLNALPCRVRTWCWWARALNWRHCVSARYRVLLPGFCEQPRDWMAAFDGFISAAREESFGLVFLEAMAAGLPIIATETQGARHLSAALDARMVPLEDVAALADALRAMHAAPRTQQPGDGRFSIDAKLSELDAFTNAREWP